MTQTEEAPVLAVIYEDTHLRVIDKPSGISVLKDNTGKASVWDLYEVRFHEPPLSVHRLDKGTSGLLIIARTVRGRRALSRMFCNREIEKTYLAWVEGEPHPESGTIDLPLEKGRKGKYRVAGPGQGLPSTTRYRLLAERSGTSLLECRPLTGRTHQIRAHLAFVGHPIVGDKIYIDPKIFEGYIQLGWQGICWKL